MKIQKNNAMLRILLLGALAISCGSVWATANSCTYPAAMKGIGGTGISGTGMGGTGIIAKGTGIGGTGISQEAKIGEMQLAGNVTLSQGTVEAQSNGRSRLLAKGDSVCVGETIVTSQSGVVQIRMADDGFIAVRPQTQVKIEKFVYRGTNKDSSLLALFKGSFRVITGKIGKSYPQNDLIETPTATIGVRGTDHEATVILPNDSGGYPSGTYDRVNTGITFIRTEKGETDIHPNQVGYVADRGELPNLLKDIPVFYNAIPSAGQEGDLSEKGKRDEGWGDDKKVGHTLEHTGEGAIFNHSLETEMPSNELPERHDDMGLPETPSLPELHESPAIPEMPERSEN